MIFAGDIGAMPSSAYGLIVADPPWPFRYFAEKQSKAAHLHYDVLTVAAIAALPVARLAARDCALLLWTTSPLLPDALKVVQAWGFRYKTNLVWRKTTARGKIRVGLGYWARSMHEQVLLAARGEPKSLRLPSLFDGLAREHSRKPEEFYELIDDRAGDMRRLDLFGREPRAGWDSFGNEPMRFASRRHLADILQARGPI